MSFNLEQCRPICFVSEALKKSGYLFCNIPSGFLCFFGGLTCSSILCCCSVAQLCPTLCNPMDCSLLVFPVLNHLPEFAQTHVHRVCDAIQPFHPLSSPPPAFNPSIRIFSNELALHIRWPKYCSFSISLCISSKMEVGTKTLIRFR